MAVACGALLAGYGAFARHNGEDAFTFTIEAKLAGPRDRNMEPRGTPVRMMQWPPAIGYAEGSRPYIYVVRDGGPGLLFERAGPGRYLSVADPDAAQGTSRSVSAAFSDYDRSGRQSLFLAGVDGVKLYRRDGRGSFSEVTRKAGLRAEPGVLFTSAVAGDLDGDGFPDLLAAAYTDLSHPPAKPVFTFPDDFAGAGSRLYRNNRDGTFTDVTTASGLAGNPGRARRAILADFNSDGRLDILLLRDDKPPALYLNRGGWKFDEATWEAGDDLTAYAFYEGAATDFNGDGKPDLALWSTHIFRVLINQGNAKFEPPDSGTMPDPATGLFGFRGAIIDLDGDGFDDVITVDGDGRRRAFLNRSGVFRETPVEMPAALSQSYLAAFRLHGAPRLMAFSPDGSIAVLKASGPRVKRRPE